MTTAPDCPPLLRGHVLVEDCRYPSGVSQRRLAVAISVPPRRINEISGVTSRICADTAVRLSRYFGKSDRFWVNLRACYALELERDRLSTSPHGDDAAGRGLPHPGINRATACEVSDRRWGGTLYPSLDPNAG